LVRIPQRDVHTPVDAPLTSKLARSIQRINNPHSISRQAGEIVNRLLRQNRILRSPRLHLAIDDGLRQSIATVFDFLALITSKKFIADGQESIADFGG
jgi:hypothetical protein